MAKHEVSLQINHLTSIGKIDITIPVRSNGRYLGSLEISKGSVDWVAGRAAKHGRYSVSCETFAELMMKDRTPKPIGKPGRRAPRKRRVIRTRATR
jgi:hypothetical protein